MYYACPTCKTKTQWQGREYDERTVREARTAQAKGEEHYALREARGFVSIEGGNYIADVSLDCFVCKRSFYLSQAQRFDYY